MRDRNNLILRSEPRPLAYPQAYMPAGMSGPVPVAAHSTPDQDGNFLLAIARHIWLVIIFALIGLGGAML
jgi:hypothetical protein